MTGKNEFDQALAEAVSRLCAKREIVDDEKVLAILEHVDRGIRRSAHPHRVPDDEELDAAIERARVTPPRPELRDLISMLLDQMDPDQPFRAELGRLQSRLGHGDLTSFLDALLIEIRLTGGDATWWDQFFSDDGNHQDLKPEQVRDIYPAFIRALRRLEI